MTASGSACPDKTSIHLAIEKAGLAVLGLCAAQADDALPPLTAGAGAQSLLLVGNAGAAMWPHFTASREYADGRPDPLNRWSARILSRIAESHGAGLLLPFEGPPYWPFQRWAMRTGTMSRSPLGVLAHGQWGLWFAFRGALLLPGPASEPEASGGPCETCAEKPCLDACPADALTREKAYEPETCRSHVAGEGQETCARIGCLIRHACPFGRDHAYCPDQATFHMRAFTGTSAPGR